MNKHLARCMFGVAAIEFEGLYCHVTFEGGNRMKAHYIDDIIGLLVDIAEPILD